MNLERLNSAVKYSRAYKRKKLRSRIVSGLAAVVIFITTYALILPAATKERPTFCGYTEHIHSSDCLSESCSLTEHEHVDSCYINSGTDFETEVDWEATLPKEFSGKWNLDIIAVAESQLGYRESSNNIATMDQVEIGNIKGGYTRYGEWYGNPYGDWASMFANFCLYYSGVDKDYFPYDVDIDKWVSALAEGELLTNTPHEGDIVFFRLGAGVDKKVGIITELIYEGEKLVRIKAVEGDSQGVVRYNEYSATAEQIHAYGDLTKAYDKYFAEKPITKTYSDRDVTVTAKYLPSAGIPEDAEFVVKPIDRENSPEEFENRFKEAEEKLDFNSNSAKRTEITGFRLYDIHFVHNGIEIQPAEKVDIKISYPVSVHTDNSQISVLHYAEEGTEIPESDYEFDKAGNVITSFETESFSLFAIVTSETIQNSVVNLSAYSVSSSTILNGLGGKTFALVNGNCSLGVDGTSVVIKKVEVRTDSTLSAFENAVCWTFEKTGNNYNIYTTVQDTKYYLGISGSSLVLKTEATAFTAARSGNNITLVSGGKYINLSSNGATAGASQAITLYNIKTGNYKATFDGKMDSATYMSASAVKYGNATIITRTADADGYIVLPTVAEAMATEPANYPVTLNGWYDIINSVYYDKSMFGTKIKITGNTTFYPEWIPVTYDIGQNKDVVPQQPDTSAFINTYVYDYNELFNVHSSYYNISDNKWYFDPDSELGFIFFDYLCHKDWGNNWNNTGGNIGYIKDKDQAVDGVTVNAEKTNGTRGDKANFPGTITENIANDARLEALFGDAPVLGKHSLGEGDWFYSYNADTGYYYYNSAKNAASYNQSEQRFYIYNHTVNIDTPNTNKSHNDFLPFNYGDPDDYEDGKVQFAEKDNEANYWFGIKSEIKFYLPDDTGTVDGNQSVMGEDMQFRFSGDDDVWVFVDDQLVLDLGGVHDMVYGEINFATGEVKTGQAKSSTDIAVNASDNYTEMPGLTGTKGITTKKLATLEGGKEHTLTIYYLERGSSFSNCAIYFNLSPLYQLKLSKKDSNGGNLLAGATFQAFEDRECTTPAELYEKWDDGTIHPIENSIFTTDENGIATCWGLFAGKTYYIKEIEAPVGYSNMSEYVIEFSLAKDGESVFIMIDSNGTDWEFAGKYHYVGGEDHLIELDIYNHKYIGGDKKFAVEKIWADGSEGIPDDITVYLYANGEDTGRSIVLNASNNWSALFYELPSVDANGNEIVYTVKEETITGFRPKYEEITYEEKYTVQENVTTAVPGYWQNVSATSGKTYRLQTPGGRVLVNESGSTVKLKTPSAEPVDTELWVVTGSGTSYSFKNVATGRYLTVSSGSITTQANSVNLTYSSNKIGRRSGMRTYYIVDNNGTLSTATSSGSGSAITLYSWVEPTTKEEVQDVEKVMLHQGYRITNYPGTKFNLLVEKIWSPTVLLEERNQVTINLYLVTIGDESNPQLISRVNITESNNWLGTFNNIEFPKEGTYYAITEETDEFAVGYSGETVIINVAGKDKVAHRVNLEGFDNNVTVQVTNSELILLPETGGIGIRLIPALGAFIMSMATLALISLLKKIKK